MIHPDIISLSGFAKETYRKEGDTFIFTDEHFDGESGEMKPHDIYISDDLLMAMYAERMALRQKIEAYRVYGTDTDGSERLLTVVDTTSSAVAVAKAKEIGFKTAESAVVWR
jgi:hypothetical protein